MTGNTMLVNSKQSIEVLILCWQREARAKVMRLLHTWRTSRVAKYQPCLDGLGLTVHITYCLSPMSMTQLRDASHREQLERASVRTRDRETHGPHLTRGPPAWSA